MTLDVTRLKQFQSFGYFNYPSENRKTHLKIRRFITLCYNKATVKQRLPHQLLSSVEALLVRRRYGKRFTGCAEHRQYNFQQY